MARFNTDIGRFDYPNSGLNQPEELGCFSLDINREFHDDTSQRKYFIKPLNYDNVRFDLTKGYEGMFAVTLHKGTYYLCECPTDQSLAKIKQMMGEKDEEMCGWGCKFEQYLTANSVPTPDMRYNNCETFYTVVKATIGSHTLVYSGEVDAVSTDEPFGEHYVEYKLRNWWTQSVLVGVPEIVCGLRDDAGIVTKLQTYNTQDLPTMAIARSPAGVFRRGCDLYPASKGLRIRFHA
ncbi:DXO-like protein [Mya arenaria]|uniref:Decapping nuclease n=1 Tax=Mya arenaria TaxID=6604 RepID=A0ABY7FHE4_MYAAR|nr:DXO-like protein [Mya arenaria]